MAFLTTVLINLTLMAAIATSEDDFSLATFGDRQFDRRLGCGIIKTVVAHHIDCQELCADTLTCFSTNTYNNGKDICELVSGTKASFDEECFEKKEGGIHSELSSTNLGNTLRKALPDGWYQLGSSAFKFFPAKMKTTKTEAKETCTANQAELAQKFPQNFVFGVFYEANRYYDVHVMRPLKLWKLDGYDQDVELNASATFSANDDTLTDVLELPGTAYSFATTPKFTMSRTNFSISFWIKTSDFSQFTYQEASPLVYSSWDKPHVFAITPSMFTTRKSYFQKYTNFMVKHQRVLPTDQWINVVSVWNRYSHHEGKASMYINGEKVNEVLRYDSNRNGVGFPNPGGTVFDIGYNRESKAVMKGRIRDVVVFSRPLTDEEVKKLADALDHRFTKAICRKKV